MISSMAVRAGFRSLRLSPRFNFTPNSIRCRSSHVKPPSPSPAYQAKPSSLRPASKAPSTTKNLAQTINHEQNKQALAERMWREGRHEIYKAPSHFGLITGAWILAGSGWLCVTYYSKSGMLDVAEMTSRGINVLVPYTYWGVAMFIAVLSGICLSRSFWFVKSIKLIKPGEAGNSKSGPVKLFVQQRSWLPGRSLRYTVEPWKLSIEREVAMVAENPTLMMTDVRTKATAAAAVGGVLKNTVLMPYLIVRKLFTYESVLTAYVSVTDSKGKSKDKMLRIDADGTLSNGGKDLVDLATFRD